MSVGARCKACDKPLVWALSPAGKRSPIEAEPSEDGNVLLLAPRLMGDASLDSEYLAVVLSAEMLERVRKEAPGSLRLSHFAHCPNREEFRQGGSRRRSAA